MRSYCRCLKVVSLLVGCAAWALALQEGDVSAYLSTGDYVRAIEAVLRSRVSKVEKDGVTGVLILDGLVDPDAKTKPPYTLADGFARMERAALRGRRQSVADLRAKFEVGINYQGKNSLMAPVEALASCWRQVEGGSQKAAGCVALRRQLRVP
jgi:hypothetical protein